MLLMKSTTLSDELTAAGLPAFAQAWTAWLAEPSNLHLDAEACVRCLLDAHRQATCGGKVEAFFRSARLASHFALATFEATRRVGLEPQHLAHLARMGWAALGQTVVITGPSRSGKTHLAAALGREAISRGTKAMLVQVPRMLDRLLDPDLTTKERKRYLAALSRVRLLILDDFATEGASRERTVLLRSLLDERSRAGLPLIVTSINPVDDWDRTFEDELSREGIYGRVLGGACHRIRLNRREAPAHAKRGSGVRGRQKKQPLPDAA